MKTIKMLLMAVLTIVSVTVFAQADTKNTTGATKQKKDKQIYTCPMHPAVSSVKPGKCPECGMELKKTGKIAKAYSCTMHAEVTSDKPGKCEKCGMNLMRTPKEKMKMEVMKMYTCPMHADVTSDKPGKCSKCGMDLAKVKNKTKEKN